MINISKTLLIRIALTTFLLGSRCGPGQTSPPPTQHQPPSPITPVPSAVVKQQSTEGAEPGNRPPNVTIASPAESVPIYRDFGRTFVATASDTDGFVRRITFLADGKAFGVDETEPYSANLRRTTLGPVKIQALAVDDEGQTGSSTVTEYRVEECPPGQLCEEELGSELASGMIAETWIPIVHWIRPKPAARHVAPADITLEVDARDKDGKVTKVEFLVNDRVIGARIRPPYRFVWRGIGPGTYEVVARAIDDLRAPGFSTPNTITVQVE